MRIDTTLDAGRFFTAVFVFLGVTFLFLGAILGVAFYALRDAF